MLKLVDDAVVAGWPQARVCRQLGISDVRVHRWRRRLFQVGILEDRAPGGNPVHRLLASLEQHGFVRRDPATRTYFPGPTLAELGLATAGMELRAAVKPVLHRLCDQVKESLHLTVLEGTSVLFLDSVETSRGLRIGSRAGVVMVAHCTSAGKAMLAQLPRDQVDSMYTGPRALEAMPERSITTLGELHAELALIRERGYATNFEESETGVSAVAAALPASPGGRLAAISVSAPTTRLTEDGVKTIAKELIEATASVVVPA